MSTLYQLRLEHAERVKDNMVSLIAKWQEEQRKFATTYAEQCKQMMQACTGLDRFVTHAVDAQNMQPTTAYDAASTPASTPPSSLANSEDEEDSCASHLRNGVCNEAVVRQLAAETHAPKGAQTTAPASCVNNTELDLYRDVLEEALARHAARSRTDTSGCGVKSADHDASDGTQVSDTD